MLLARAFRHLTAVRELPTNLDVAKCRSNTEYSRLTKNIDSQAIHRTGNGMVPSTL